MSDEPTPEALRAAAELLARFCATQQPPASPAPDPDFELAGEPPVRTAKLTKQDEARYSKMYAKGWRQIRRWVERGEKAGDRCPLEDPRALMQWWPRHFKWRVPPEIEQAAFAASKTSPPPVSSAGPPAADPPPPPADPGKSIDLESFDPEEGDRLRELKQIQAAKFAQLKEALRAGEDCTILEGKYLKLSETIDKIETRVTERMKKRGLFILRAAVERDLAAAAELLRQSRESMDRRVQELCPSLAPEQRAEVSEAIGRARRSEERILAALPTLQQGEDIFREMVA